MFKPTRFLIFFVSILFAVAVKARSESESPKCTAYLADLGFCTPSQKVLSCGSSLAKNLCCRANSACPPGHACASADGAAGCTCITRGSNVTAKFENCPQTRTGTPCGDLTYGNCCDGECTSYEACINPPNPGEPCICSPSTCVSQSTPNCYRDGTCQFGKICLAADPTDLSNPNCVCKDKCNAQVPFTCSYGQDCFGTKLCGLDENFENCVCRDPCTGTGTCQSKACANNQACVDIGGTCTCATPCSQKTPSTCSAGACPVGQTCDGDGTNPCTCKIPCDTDDGVTTCLEKYCPDFKTCFGSSCTATTPCECNPTPCFMQSKLSCGSSTCPTTGQRCSLTISGDSCECSTPPCNLQDGGLCSLSTCPITGEACYAEGGGCLCKKQCDSETDITKCTIATVCSEGYGCYSNAVTCACESLQCASIPRLSNVPCSAGLCGSVSGLCFDNPSTSSGNKCKCPNQGK